MPSLPNALLSLWCADNALTSLPVLPDSLQGLDCERNQLTSLPPLPSTLLGLYCSGNLLTSLPILPGVLRDLYCNDNYLTNLPVLPNWLRELRCSGNQITALPALPNLLELLDCSSNQITNLPALPSGIWELHCSDNQLNGLPALPDNLMVLSCSNNLVTSLPTLPNWLQELHCQDNPFLSCLPLLPMTLYDLDVAQTAITCLPNSNNILFPGTAAVNFLPLCTDPNQICDSGYPWVLGNIYQDLDGNGQFGTGEPRIGGIQVNGSVWPVFSNANVPHWLYLTPDTLNTVWVNDIYPVWDIVPDTHYVVAPLAGQVTDTLNFGLTPISPNAQDLQVALAASVARPGFNTSASARVLNAGTSAQSVTFSMTFPANWTLLSTIPVGGAVTGNTVTWQTPNPLGLFERDTFGLVLNVPAAEPLGTPFTYAATANLPLGEVTPTDNSAVFSGLVQGAYDPNDKLVRPEILPPGYDAEQELVYTIRFQNTGNDTAFNVLIRDTLAATLRPETFRMLHSSHPCVPGFEGPNRLKFTFSNILLVDSFTNEPASHGFVQFAIKPVADLPLNTVFANRAGIYFDYNAPIITNYAETQVFLGGPQAPGGAPVTVRVFPNPAEQSTRFTLDAPLAGPATLTLFNALGQAVRSLELPAGALGAELPRGGLPAGLYFFELADGNALRVAGRLVWR